MPGNSTETVSMSVLRETFETNFFAPIALTQKLLPLLKKSDAGRIVNVSSIMGSLALHSDSNSPIYGIKLLAYNSSKTALNQFTVHLAEALKDTRIKVNSAHPGWVKTDLGGAYAPMTIEEGVKTIVDLSTLDKDGPNGAFIHMGEVVPW
jgi:NAD(P)-dependent dehydrogenase (short-subunit alcohol dehydrogenase family)